MTFNEKNLVTTFEVPTELAQELSELLIKEDILQTSIDHLFSQGDEKWTEVMEQLTKVKSRINTLKNKVTNDFVPDQYRDQKYVWNYEGEGITFQIYKTE